MKNYLIKINGCYCVVVVKESRGRGRPKMIWEKVVERDMKVRGLVRNDAKD